MEPSQLSDVILEDYGPEFDYLPTEFQYAHQYCFHLHNQLVETLISAEEAQVFHITLEFDDPEQYRELDGLLGEDLYAWMMQNGFESDALLLGKGSLPPPPGRPGLSGLR